MFAPLLRCRTGPDVVMTNPRGRALTLTSLPITPVRCTIRDGGADDFTPDHLASTSSHQPCRWCQISEVNPACLSPRAFWNDPIVTDRFPISFVQPHFSCDAVVQELMRRVGVESATVGEAASIVPTTQTLTGKTVLNSVEQSTLTMIVTYNRMHLSPSDIACMIASHGLRVGEPQTISRVSEDNVMPPL